MSKYPLLEVNTRAVLGLIEFAQMEIESTRQVEEAAWIIGWSLGMDPEAPFDTLPEGERDEYITQQQTLRGWLEKVSKWHSLTTRQREQLLKEMKVWADMARSSLRSTIEDGKLIRRSSINFDCVRSVIGESLFVLMSGEKPYPTPADIGQCPQCNAFFMKTRADQKACSAKCRVYKSRRHR